MGNRKYFNAGKFDDAESQLLERLKDSYKSRNVSDVPLCLLYSGGIDSNTLLYLSCANNSNSLALYFADNSKSIYSEFDNVNEGYNYFSGKYDKKSISLYSHKVDIDEYLENIDELAWYYDEPIQFINSILLDNLCYEIKNNNFKVALSGEGSDEIFYGYDRFIRTNNDFNRSETIKKKIKLA